MCREIKELKMTNNYDFSNLLIEDEMNQTQKNEINLEIENIADMLSHNIIQNNRDIEPVRDKPYATPIIGLAHHFGFTTFSIPSFEDFPLQEYKNSSGMISISGDYIDLYRSDKIMIINSKENTGHQRFTVAHELGHYVFDFNELDNYTYTDFYRTDEAYINNKEVRASRFAAALLMPREKFIERYMDLSKSNHYTYYELVNILSSDFLVSPSAVDRRIRELKEIEVII